MKKNQQEPDITDQNVLISLIKTKLESLLELSSTKPDLFKEEMHNFFLEYPINSNKDMVTRKLVNQQWDIDLLAFLIYKEVYSSSDNVSNTN